MGMRTVASYSEAIVHRLTEQKETVTFAESCTGGWLAASLVAVSGASSVFSRSFVTYCDEAKAEELGVDRETLAVYTAVSEPVAAQMACGALKRANADYGVSVTGFADGEQAGLVYIGCAYRKAMSKVSAPVHVKVRELHLTGDRNQVRKKAVYQALKLLWEVIDEKM